MSEKIEDSVWSVRGVALDARTAAVSHAKKSKVSVGQWVEMAIREKIKADRQKSKAVTRRGAVSMTDASGVVDMLGKLSDAGVELPDSLKRSAVAMLRKVTVEVSKGKVIQSPSSRMTALEDGQTETESGHTD